jgi:DNA-directed RNA polymerase subunit RPC12/RpoP
MIYSNSFYIKNNGNGYELETRDAICSKCHRVIDRQTKYKGIDKEFNMSTNEKREWNNCPYCGHELNK